MYPLSWSRDPLDVAWYLIRRVIEMADRRSDFKLNGRANVLDDGIEFSFEAYGLRSRFYLANILLSENRVDPADLAEDYGKTILRNFRRMLDEKSKKSRPANKKHFRIGRQAREIEAAKQAADESKRSFVITDVMALSKYIGFSCNESLVEPIKKYGVVRPDPIKEDGTSWYISVDALYDFACVLKAFRAIEKADDCVHEYLRATCRKTNLIAWWDLDEGSKAI